MNNYHKVTKDTKDGMTTVVVGSIPSTAYLAAFVLFVSLW